MLAIFTNEIPVFGRPFVIRVPSLASKQVRHPHRNAVIIVIDDCGGLDPPCIANSLYNAFKLTSYLSHGVDLTLQLASFAIGYGVVFDNDEGPLSLVIQEGTVHVYF